MDPPPSSDVINTIHEQDPIHHPGTKEDSPPRLPVMTTTEGGISGGSPTVNGGTVTPPPPPPSSPEQAGPSSNQSEAGTNQNTLPGPTLQLAVGGTGGRCQHTRGGYCRLHGAGARKFFKPSIKTSIGPRGEVIRKVSHHTYYQCDLGQRGRGRGGLRQAQLSWTVGRPSANSGQRGDDTRGGITSRNPTGFSSTNLGVTSRNTTTDFSSTNAGQINCTSNSGNDDE